MTIAISICVPFDYRMGFTKGTNNYFRFNKVYLIQLGINKHNTSGIRVSYLDYATEIVHKVIRSK